MISEAVAAGRSVIVGRGAECVLPDREYVLRVFIYAPWKERASRVRSRLEPPQDVAELLRSTDRKRGSYICTYHGCDWKDPDRYHMITSSHMGAETAA